MSEQASIPNWSLRRAWLVGSNAFLEAARLKLFYALLILALLSFCSSFLLREFSFGASELKFIADFGFGGITFFGSALAIIGASQLFYRDIDHRTALPLLAKPLRRSEFLVGKFFGILMMLACFVFALAISLAIALWLRQESLLIEYPDLADKAELIELSDIFGFALLQVVRLGTLASIVMLFATYATSSLFAMLMGLLVWVAGQLQYLASSVLGRLDSDIVNALLWAGTLLVPNFHLFDIGDRIALGESIPFILYLKIGLYGALYTAFYLAAAATSFHAREL